MAIYRITYNSDVDPADRGPTEVEAAGHEVKDTRLVFFNRTGDEVLRLDNRTVRSVEDPA